MFWIIWILIALWVVVLILDIYFIRKNTKEFKTDYRFVVCEQNGESLIPIDVFYCESDARQRYFYLANKVVVRVMESDLRWYRKNVSG